MCISSVYIRNSTSRRLILSPLYNYVKLKMSSNANDICSTHGYSLGHLKVLERNQKRFERIKFLGKLFEAEGFELRIAGGAVRDILGGKDPQDIDFATTARPEKSLELLKKHEDIVRIIVTAAGQKHGTVAVKFKETKLDFKKIKFDQDRKENEDKSGTSSITKPVYDDESPFEITTLRCDTITDGRHAEVEFVNDWRIDAERRDLTINAMFLTLNDGKLIDYFNGESDLKNGIVRFVGDADRRIKEDYLRILRFFRFWSRYGANNQPDSETLATLKENLVGLDKISGERLWQEIKKTLMKLPCYEVVELMIRLKVFEHVGLVDKNIKDYDEYAKQVLQDIKIVQSNVETYCQSDIFKKLLEDSSSAISKRIRELLPVILFAATVQTLEMCTSACHRMKFSNVERDSIIYILENKDKTPTIRELKYQLAMARGPDRPIMLNKMRALLIYKGEINNIKLIESWQVPEFPINGHTVLQECKKRKLPGDKIKVILETIKDTWASGDYKLTKEELMQQMNIKLDELRHQN